MASRNSAIVSKFVKRSLSASTQPEQVKKSLKHFTEIPGLTVKGGFQLLDLIIIELKSHMTC